MAFRKLAVLDIHGLDPVQHDYQLRTSGHYLVGVPFAAGLGVGRYLRDIGDGPSPVTRVRPLVVYIHLVGTLTADVFGIGIANKNTAIRRVIRPELGPYLEVLVGVLRDQMAALALVGHDGAVLRPPAGIADPIPVVQGLGVGAVKKCDPPSVALTRHLL